MTGLVAAWIIVQSLTGQVILRKQLRIDPMACRLPAVKAEYPVDGKWRDVTLQIRCTR